MKERMILMADHGFRVAAIAEKHGEAETAARLRAQAHAIREVFAGDIGKPVRHVDLPGEEPLTVPEFDPEEVPEDVPELEPEKVPA